MMVEEEETTLNKDLREDDFLLAILAFYKFKIT